MENNNQNKGHNILVSFLGLLVITPLIILKSIGDIIINIGKYFLHLFYETYKKIKLVRVNFNIQPVLYTISISFQNLIKSVKLNIRNPFKYLASNNKKLNFPKRKKKTLFHYYHIPRLKLNLPRLPTIPLPSKLFFVKTKYFFFGAFFILTFVVIIQVDNLVNSLPNPVFLSLRDVPATTKIYDRNGKLLYEIYADENRTPIKLSEMPKIIKDATIAIEDSEFLSHQGISIRGSLRALYHNLTTDSLEGGSTITQQLIRSALLTPERTLSRKLKEIVLSVWAEHVYSKEQILEMYLNQVPYGGTAWGIEAASETYFGKNVGNLDLAEAAFLAGLPAAPTHFSPYGARPELAKIRQEEVLKRMEVLGFINKNQQEEAFNESLNLRRPTIPIAAPHFVMYVKDLLEQQYGTKFVEREGLRVTTSLDLNIQEMAQKSVTTQIDNLQSLNVGNGAALITNPNTGEILAMVGGRDYFDKEKEGNVNLTTALRQPGSSIKVVNYAAALSLGYTAASILDDSPISFKLAGLSPYSPLNYDGQFHGRIPLRVALASSYNVPAVKVLATIGVDKMINQGKLMGIESWLDENKYGLSLTLGGGDVTMLDMSKVYGTLATGGTRHNLTPILKITNWKGETLPLPTQKGEVNAVIPEISFILSSILSDNNARTPAFGPNSALVIPGKTVAVKTGTSDNKRDNWTIGYTPDYVAVVWVGNNDNSPMNRELTSGITGAAPIWNEIMTNLLKDKPDKPFLLTSNIITLPCYGRIEYFVAGTEPKGGCPNLITPSPSPNP
ncbi:transglycosylase domain-containing protein [Candidatus Gottesmanbacteria bacterium]|nr:transglycosylase domain-containing protein [Candidatus Gottesmanbacteria bacterium]